MGPPATLIPHPCKQATTPAAPLPLILGMHHAGDSD